MQFTKIKKLIFLGYAVALTTTCGPVFANSVIYHASINEYQDTNPSNSFNFDLCGCGKKRDRY